MTRRALIWIVTGLVLTLVACGGGPKAPTLEDQLDQARVLNSDLRAELDEAQTLFKTTLTASQDLPVLTVDPTKLDVDLLRKALFECFESPIAVGRDSAAGGAVADGSDAPIPPCEGLSVDALRNLIESMEKTRPEIAKFYNNKLGDMAAVRIHFKKELPSRTQRIIESQVEARKKIEELEFAVTQAKKDAKEADMTTEQRRQYRANLGDLNTELDAIKTLLDTHQNTPKELNDQVRTAIDTLLGGLTKLSAM